MLKGNNLIQTIPNKPFICFGKTEIHLQANPYQNWSKMLIGVKLNVKNIQIG